MEKGESMPKQRGYVHQNENWLDARDQTKTPLYLKNLDRIYFFEYLPKEKALYVRHSRVADDAKESTEKFYKRVFDFVENNDVNKLIIDVRLNGGGNSYLNKSIITGIIETKKINKVGNLYVIIGNRTYSAAQNLVNELHNYTNAIFVGEPTSENVNFWGDARPVTFPNSGLIVHLSYAWWQGKPVWEYAEWLAPQVPVEMSFSDYKSNQDPVLKAALSFSGKDFKINPLELHACVVMSEGIYATCNLSLSEKVFKMHSGIFRMPFEGIIDVWEGEPNLDLKLMFYLHKRPKQIAMI